MIDIKLKTDDRLQAALLMNIQNGNDYFKSIQYEIKNKNNDLYSKCSDVRNFDSLECENCYKEMIENYSSIKMPFLETEKYKNETEEYYKENYEFLADYFENKLKIKEDKFVEGFIVHPGMNEGRAKYGQFVFGHRAGVVDKNYSLSYIIHEAFHCIYPYPINATKEEENIIHSVIELATDNELYTLLSEKQTFPIDRKFIDSGFIMENKYEMGHLLLGKTKEKLIPAWISFLGLDEKEVKERGLDNYPIYEEDLSELKFEEFIDYCLEKNKEVKRQR